MKTTIIAVLLRCRWLSFAAPLALMSCGAPEMRLLTYPPDFVYVERRELNTVMWQLASSVAALDHALGSEPGSQVDLAAAATALRELDQAAAKLPITTTSTHPMLGERAERFRRDVRLAREHIEETVPDVSLARGVTGACMYCHSSSVR